MYAYSIIICANVNEGNTCKMIEFVHKRVLIYVILPQ